ncbi:PREDICTED: protein asteroid homolog 1-like [Amphimedon queenslandica]|uniref:Asteroid domain-containing protein n=1 Tax=Amphimedon queenslandica TaxID=400682 RepID=A0AAN0J9P2_AMPQE|nr:PREDICTED: protein asteroid homolog 1-like [Amphimedon queenslandica]|eukprot:XP_019853423.1 PREDICTED: protein asteroid homolog 1-like [Amphimedon queenslandica]
MGIKGLTTYMQKNYEWKEIGKDSPLRGQLLIDAMSCCYSLYDGIDWTYGGQYKEFDQKCRAFLANLRQSGIEPIFVFDGVDYEGEKARVILERKEKTAKCIQSLLLYGNYPIDGPRSCLPVFAKVVFMEVLKELRIPFIVADGDADSLTVSISNFYGCPVLSSDSDYYIFNVKGGYIPFEYFYWESKPINAKIYHLSNFSAIFREPEIIYLIPALIGNDFLESPHLGENTMNTDELVEWIASFRSVEKFLSRFCKSEQVMAIRENFHKAKDMYSIDEISMDDARKSTELKTANGTPLPSWILEQYRDGCFSTSVLDPMILNECILPMITDNPKKESSMKIGKPLREYMYGLLKPYLEVQKVEEGMRIGQCDIQFKPVRPLAAPQCLITDVDALRDEERLGLLCNIFEVLPDELGQFENKWKLVALSLHYWSRNAEALTWQQIDALLFSLLFNGRLCLYYACMKEADFDVIKEETLTKFPDMARLCKELLSICSPREVSRGSSSHKASKEKHKQPAAAAKKTYSRSTPVSTANPFGLLADLDEEN